MASTSGFTPIQNLSLNGQFVDVIGVVVDLLAPSPTAGSDWQCTFNLADERSTFEGQRVKMFAQRDKMPPIRGTGDVVILRQIQLKPYRGSTFLLFNYRTTWTVFHLGGIPEERPSEGDLNIPCVTSPNTQKPTKSDMLRAIELADIQPRPDWTSTVPEKTPSGAPEPTPITPLREKFSLIADIGANQYFDLIGQVVKMFPTGDRLDLYITDYTENSLLFDYDAENAEGGEAGRDGDDYAYLNSTKKKKLWKGPSGKYTLTVTLFWPHTSFAQSKVRENDYVLLRNVHIKIGRNGSCRLEGALHTDKKFPERVNIEKVSAENDERVEALLRRKKYYQKEHPERSSGATSIAGKKRPSTDSFSTKGMTKDQVKKARRRQREAEKNGQDPHEAPTNTLKAQSKTGVSAGEHTALEVNKQVACTHPHRPTRPISEINDTETSHLYIAPDGLRVAVPFINQLFRAQVRVVDFQPAELADFAVRTSEFDTLSDVDEDDAPTPAGSPSPSPSPPPSTSQRGADEGGDEAVESRKRWTWFFTLIVQDAHASGPKDHRDRIAIHVADADAEFLLGMEAVNLRRERNEQVLHQLREKLFLLWGDLEERKTSAATTTAAAARKALAHKDANLPAPTPEEQDKEAARKERVELRNNSSLPFVCCVKEYGVQKSQDVWKRRFRMFGTSIQ